MNKNLEKRFLTIPLEVRAADDGKRTISGYAIVFNQLSRNLGWFREKIDPEALTDADMSDVLATFNHNRDYVLARTSSKTLTLKIDERGLHFSFEVPNTTWGNDVFEMVSRGDVSGCSFVFTADSDKWEEDGEAGEIRTVLKIKRIYDVCPVTDPAYLQTEVEAAKRSYDQYKKETDDPTGKDKKGYPLGLAQLEVELLNI